MLRLWMSAWTVQQSTVFQRCCGERVCPLGSTLHSPLFCPPSVLMTHQHASQCGGEEVKAAGQQPLWSSAASPPQPTQCCVYFAPSEWSHRYGIEFYTARVTQCSQASDGGHVYGIVVRCGDSEWSVDRPYSAYRRLLTDVAASYRTRPDGEQRLPALPADKADAAVMQSWMDDTLQRKEISRVAAVRHFLSLDTHIPHIQHEQQADSDDEQQQQQDTATQHEDGEQKQTGAAQQ